MSTEKYRRWARTVKKGTVIKLPKVTKTGYKAAWETKISDKTKQYNPGSKVTIKKNIKFCLKFYKKNSTQTGTSANQGLKLRIIIREQNYIKITGLSGKHLRQFRIRR